MKNFFTTAASQLVSIIGYTPPSNPDPFILDENRPFDGSPPLQKTPSAAAEAFEQLEALLRFGRRLRQTTQNTLELISDGRLREELDALKQELAALEKQWQELLPVSGAFRQNQPNGNLPLSASLEENKHILRDIYRLPRNKDVVIRDFKLASATCGQASLVYTEGLVDGKRIEEFILKQLMHPVHEWNFDQQDILGQIIDHLLPSAQLKKVSIFHQVEEGINSGDTMLLIDGLNEGILITTKGWEHRSVSTPQTEQTVRGSQAAFSENLRVNTGLIRSILRSSDLVTEMVSVGKRGKLNCAIMYLESIANPALTREVKRRIEGISTDYIVESGQLMQFIEDYPANIFPQSISTERPDRAANYLVEGHVAIILEGNPFINIIPVSFFYFFHSAEDFSVKSGISNFMRILRLFGALVSSVLPSLYIAIAYFHQEAIPTELLLAIAGSRENVPFPAIFEVLMMEVSFELIREAGIRIPGVLGSTIGIVGAIILGQAAVTARIVSPIIVVIIAITGLASFTIPEYRMASAVRIIRFILLLFSWVMGLVGLALALLGITVMLCRLKSFGMPYMVPIGPRTLANYDVVLRGPVYSQDTRPDALNTREQTRQPKVSRLWKTKPPAGGEE